MPYSLVLGTNGQDGSYLADSLLRRGHVVIGVGRQDAPSYDFGSKRFEYISLDIGSASALTDVLCSYPLDYVFHAAAVHGPSGFEYESVWQSALAVNIGSIQTVLEHARTRARDLRVMYAGSCKIFPNPHVGVINEDTPARGTCLYSIGKMASRELLSYYRQRHGVSTTNLILFNHESPRRDPSYLFPQLVRAIASALTTGELSLQVRTLNFSVDWSAADEIMDIVADLAVMSDVPEVVLGSGQTWTGRAAVDHLFSAFGIAGAGSAQLECPDLDYTSQFRVSLDRLAKAINRVPTKTIVDIATDILNTNYRLQLPLDASRA